MSATATDPSLPFLTAAREQIAKGDLKKAALTLNKAGALWPQDPRMFVLAGLMAEKSGNVEGAFEALRKAVELSPDFAPAILELALLLARQNQFQEATEWAERVAALEPSNPLVLAGVVDIAHRAGQTEMAVRHLRHGLVLVPGDVQLRRLLARDLGSIGEVGASLAIWAALVNENPADAEARMGRVQTLIALGRAAEARQDTEALLAEQPDDDAYAYYHAIASGDTPPQQPASLSRSRYDSMASAYDQHIVRGLKYRLPKLVADALLARRPDKKFNLLDLGCGTGLLGVCLGRLDGYLIGVEISHGMIEQAARHRVYDKFHNVDIRNALAETPDSQYEIITALDVFIYLGALEQVIPNALRILTPGGQFVFSCESAPEDGSDLVLQANGRYAHKASHIEALCQSAGFASVTLEPLVLRTEDTQDVHGFLVTADKAA